MFVVCFGMSMTAIVKWLVDVIEMPLRLGQPEPANSTNQE